MSQPSGNPSSQPQSSPEKHLLYELIDVYSNVKEYAYILYALLCERDETINISHKKLPEYEDHVRFVDSRPYAAWYLYKSRDIGTVPDGAVYLTKKNEIGVFIYKKKQGQGHGRRAVQMLMEKHGPLPYLANINPANERSIKLFKSLGFTHIQNTYQCAPKPPATC